MYLLNKYAADLDMEALEENVDYSRLILALNALKSLSTTIHSSDKYQEALEADNASEEPGKLENTFKEFLLLQDECLSIVMPAGIDQKLLPISSLWENFSTSIEKARTEYDNKCNAAIRNNVSFDFNTKIEVKLKEKFTKEQKRIYDPNSLRDLSGLGTSVRDKDKEKSPLLSDELIEKMREQSKTITPEFIEEEFQKYKKTPEYRNDKRELEATFIKQVASQDYNLVDASNKMTKLLHDKLEDVTEKTKKGFGPILRDISIAFNKMTAKAIELDKIDYDNNTTAFLVEDDNIDLDKLEVDLDEEPKSTEGVEKGTTQIEKHLKDKDYSGEETQLINLVRLVATGSDLFELLIQYIQNKVSSYTVEVMKNLQKAVENTPSDIMGQIEENKTQHGTSGVKEEEIGTTSGSVAKGPNLNNLNQILKDYFNKMKAERIEMRTMMGEDYENAFNKARAGLFGDAPIQELTAGLTALDRYHLTRKIKMNPIIHNTARAGYHALDSKEREVTKAIEKYFALLETDEAAAEAFHAEYVRRPAKKATKDFTTTPFFVVLDKQFRANPLQAKVLLDQKKTVKRTQEKAERTVKANEFVPANELFDTDQLILSMNQIISLELATKRANSVPMDPTLQQAINVWKTDVAKIWGKQYDKITPKDILSIRGSNKESDIEKRDALLLDINSGPDGGPVLLSEEQKRELSTKNKDDIRKTLKDLFKEYKIEYLTDFDPVASEFIKKIKADSPAIFTQIFGEDPTNMTTLKTKALKFQAEGIGEFYAKLMSGNNQTIYRLLQTLDQKRPKVLKDIIEAKDLQASAPSRLLEVVRSSRLLGKEDLALVLNNLYVTKAIIRYVQSFKDKKKNSSMLLENLLKKAENNIDVANFLETLDADKVKAYKGMDQQELSALYNIEKYKPYMFFDAYSASTYSKSWESQLPGTSNPIPTVDSKINESLPLREDPIFSRREMSKDDPRLIDDQDEFKADKYVPKADDGLNSKTAAFIDLINKAFG